MKVSLTIHADTPGELATLQELITQAAEGKVAKPPKAGKKPKAPKEEEEEFGEDDSEEEEESEDDDSEEESDEEEDSEDDEDEEEEKPAKGKKGSKGPSKEDVIEALASYAKLNSREKAKALLKKVGGVDSVKDLDVSKYAALIAKLNK